MVRLGRKGLSGLSKVTENGYLRLLRGVGSEVFEIYFGDTLVMDDGTRCLYLEGPRFDDNVPEYFMLIDVEDGDVYAFSEDHDDLWRFSYITEVVPNMKSVYRRELNM